MESDRFLQNFNASDRKIAEEFLTNWLPFLNNGLCKGCSDLLRDRIRSLNTGHGSYRGVPEDEEVDGKPEGSVVNGEDEDLVVASSVEEHVHDSYRGVPQDEEVDDKPEGSVVNAEDEDLVVASNVEEHVRGSPESFYHIEPTELDADQEKESHKASMSWADMAQQDDLDEERKKNLDDVVVDEKGEMNLQKIKLSREQRERIRFAGVGRKKDFVCLERMDGKIVNILKGLELHTGVFSAVEQKRIVDLVYELQEKGRNNEFGEHTYSEPRKWMRGKGRVTIQFGCCYNYAEKNGIPPGILRNAIADPIPNFFKVMIKRLIRWHVLPTYCVPDSCIVNIYEPGDCIPPHIDNHDFVRPFCTVSFLSECNIIFGSNLKIAGPGEFTGSISIPLPVGSVLVLNGNGADVAKHCVPAVPYKRISITFRKMDKAKWPHGFKLEPDLQKIKPYDLSAEIEPQQENKEREASADFQTIRRKPGGRPNRAKNKSLHWDDTEELIDRSSHHGSENGDGSSSVGDRSSSERRVPIQQRLVYRNRDRDNDSSIRRQTGWDSRHRKERIRTLGNSQRMC